MDSVMRRASLPYFVPLVALCVACGEAPTTPFVVEGTGPLPAFSVLPGEDVCQPPGFIGPGTVDGVPTGFFFCIAMVVTDGVASMSLNAGEGALSTISDPVWVYQAADTLSPVGNPPVGPFGATGGEVLCRGSLACVYGPQQSGRVYLTLTWAGPEGHSHYVEAWGPILWVRDSIPEEEACTMFDDDEVSDALLLDPTVHQILSELAKLSHFDEPFPNRLERGGYIVEQPDGTIEFVEHRYLTPEGALGGQPELCVLPYDGALQGEIRGAGGTILGQIHTHPTQRGSERNPGNCNQWLDNKDGTYTVKLRPEERLSFRPGPSAEDTKLWKNGAASWPGYMMSPDRVYRWERKGQHQTGLDHKDNFKIKKGADACIAR